MSSYDVFIHNLQDASSSFPWEKLQLNHQTNLFFLNDRDPSCLVCVAIPNVHFRQVSFASKTHPELHSVQIAFEDSSLHLFFQTLQQRFSPNKQLLSDSMYSLEEKQIEVSFAINHDHTTVYCYNSLQESVSDDFLRNESLLPVTANLLLQIHSSSSVSGLCLFLLQCMVQTAPVENYVVHDPDDMSMFFSPTDITADTTSNNYDSEFLFPLAEEEKKEETFDLYQDTSSDYEAPPASVAEFTFPVSIENEETKPTFDLYVEEPENKDTAEIDFFATDATASSFDFFKEIETVPSIPEGNDHENEAGSAEFSLFDAVPLLSQEEQDQTLSLYEEEAKQLPVYSKQEDTENENEEEGDKPLQEEEEEVIRSNYRQRRRQWKSHLKSHFHQVAEHEQPPVHFNKAWIPAISYLSSDDDDHSSSDDEDEDFDSPTKEKKSTEEENAEDDEDDELLLVY